jgi:hypothetical protein
VNGYHATTLAIQTEEDLQRSVRKYLDRGEHAFATLKQEVADDQSYGITIKLQNHPPREATDVSGFVVRNNFCLARDTIGARTKPSPSRVLWSECNSQIPLRRVEARRRHGSPSLSKRNSGEIKGKRHASRGATQNNEARGAAW